MNQAIPEIEQTILGAVLLQGITDEINFLRPEHFAYKGHYQIFRAIRNLIERKETTDLPTVANELKNTNQLETAGGAYYLATLTNRVASTANIQTHARIIVQEYLKRKAYQIGLTMERSVEAKNDPFDIIERAQTKLNSLLEKNIEDPIKDFSEIQHDTIKHLEQVQEKKQNGQLTGIPTGFKRLDAITGGWQDTDLIIVAARPSMGKTALMVTLALNAAKAGFPVAIFSLEMSELQISYRAISAEHCIDLTRIIQGNMYSDEIEQVKNDPIKYPLMIDTTSALHIQAFRNKAAVAVKKHGAKMIVVDYLQLMRGDKKNREQEITEISGMLKAVAKDLKVPVIALSQLSRAVEYDADKIPKLSHLRESGSIEQDADIVSFLWRPEYYGITGEAGEELTGLAKLFIAKNRNGSLALGDYGISMEFQNKYTKFKDYDLGTEAQNGQQVDNEQPF